MEWPGLTFQVRSDSESEADDLLHDNEIAPNIIISGQMGGNIQTIDVTNVPNEQKAIEKKHRRLCLELATLVEFARPFVQTTYFLEGMAV